jgi:hypothetical protein
MSNVIQFRPRPEEPSYGDGNGPEVIEVVIKLDLGDWDDDEPLSPSPPPPAPAKPARAFAIGGILGFLLGGF